ncbi:MAG TPA: hypothetical protein IGS40_15130 [Trichormus sp. M33_DOE_039]|nr:hypothetical protein [Trichormus sp. M33_DOE_039]
MLKILKSQIVLPIKLISIVLITSAISLEVWNIYRPLNNETVNAIFWFGRFALISHFLEAVIATIYASSKDEIPLKYGIYTFFVGTIGLLELFRKEDI